ncbi:hypothetical protein TELCIR_08024 [Teladorsagia circumcincta]|uniref:Uncharacterized protein n=1 Tax=Teladorsagia circumcincta TaxID=45464 RepID=A0A2G9UIQ6_TELCI|nr:hypothetical protein TELCIR_08024 [Teladorsagia circumcincta]
MVTGSRHTLKTELSSVFVFSYFQNILANVDAGAVEVELLVDGSYRTVKSECVDVDSDASTVDEKPPCDSGVASGSGTGSAPPAKCKPNYDDDIIVLSDSDDDEQQAVERAIRASIVESGAVRPTNPPSSPSRSHDSSIIILDDDSPPRPPAPPPPNVSQ